MSKRPIIKLKLNITDLIFEMIGWIALSLLWIIIILDFSSLPDIIPTHFNTAGKPDGYGEKAEIFSLPIVCTLTFISITILNKFPHIFNYLVEITTENALKQYQFSTRMLRILKLVIVLIFISITLLTINFTRK